jgi:hypothetical protein
VVAFAITVGVLSGPILSPKTKRGALLMVGVCVSVAGDLLLLVKVFASKTKILEHRYLAIQGVVVPSLLCSVFALFAVICSSPECTGALFFTYGYCAFWILPSMYVIEEQYDSDLVFLASALCFAGSSLLLLSGISSILAHETLKVCVIFFFQIPMSFSRRMMPIPWAKM